MIMKMYKHICMMMICLLMLCSLGTASAYAVTMIDKDKPVSLELTYKYNGEALTGTDFDLYHVAEIDAYGELIATAPFTSFDVNIYGENDKAWENLTNELASYVKANKVSVADYGKVDNNGRAIFPNNTDDLKQGLYLVVGHSVVKDGTIYETVPFLVLLPSIDDDTKDWTYEVTAFPKPGEQSNPEPPTPNEPNLPQTGQLWWPVPMMVMVGLVFIIAGVVRRKSTARNEK